MSSTLYFAERLRHFFKVVLQKRVRCEIGIDIRRDEHFLGQHRCFMDKAVGRDNERAPPG